MRFEIGSQVPFVHVKFEHGNFSNADGICFSTYYPWDHKLIGIDILMLSCQEHHKVAGEADDVKNEDGFIFTDADGNVWHNQYPRANGLNMSVERDIKSDEHLKAEMERGVVNFEMKGLSTYLAEVSRGIFDIQAEIDKGNTTYDYKSKLAQLQAHYDEVVLKFENMTGQRVVRTERIFGNSGVFRGFYQVHFEQLLAA